MRTQALVISGKLLSRTIQRFHLGHGSTWPGHVALKFHPQFIRDISRKSRLKTIIVAGTNGKTTTSRLVRTILSDVGQTVIHNESGANLLNGIASSLLLSSSYDGKIMADYAIFEVDENALPKILQQITPDYLMLLNLFRDQLDRYGEVDTIAKKWSVAIAKLPPETVLIVNADDPVIAYIGMQKDSTKYFGSPHPTTRPNQPEHTADSLYCPRCGSKLQYTSVTYSHLGAWHCPSCHLSRPDIKSSDDIKSNLAGTYNQYNLLAAATISRELGTQELSIANSLKNVTPAFGRQEKISLENKHIEILLAKNPTGFTESLKTISEKNAKHLLLVLNDNIADGTDVSWIWDIDFESYLTAFTSITISGTRAYDMALRVFYSEKLETQNSKLETIEKLENAISQALLKTPEGETLYILPTYTAMLEVRKIVTGKKIL